ncbi:MAG: class I SAM-dependent methyltransferase [Desulfobacteraceae bacterium]|jgi:SAM-dependent methyltransferase
MKDLQILDTQREVINRKAESNGKENLQTKPSKNVEALYNLLEESSKKYKIFCAINAAVKIGLFDILDSSKTLDELCLELSSNQVITADLCELLFDVGLLEKRHNGYMNTEISNTYLKKGSPFYQEEMIKNLKNSFTLWENLDQLLINGPLSLSDQSFFQNNLIHSLAAEMLSGELQKTMNLLWEVPEFRDARRLLDLGGGHGLYAIGFCQQNPELKTFVFDYPNVYHDTARYIKKFDAKRVHYISGDLFKDDFGDDYDVVFFSFNPGGKNPKILEKIHKCLRPGGLFITKHAFYSDHVGSKNKLLDLEWNLTALKGAGKGRHIYQFKGDLYFEDYLALMEEFFTVLQIIETPEFAGGELSKFGDRLDSKIIISKKKTQ